MMITVTGGSGSGKSAFAESLITDYGTSRRIYIATMMCFDEESRKRIARHRAMRAGKGFETLECYTGLKQVSLEEGSTVLLECMSNLAANEVFSEQGAESAAYDEIKKGILHLKEHTTLLVIVTNELFSDGNSYDAETMRYLETLGKVNQFLGEVSDSVYEVVYGIPVKQKGDEILCS